MPQSKKTGTQAKMPYAELVIAIDKAEALLELELCRAVRKAASRDWRAAAWMLERRFTERWALPSDRVKEKRSLRKMLEELLAALDSLGKKSIPFAADLKDEIIGAVARFNDRAMQTNPEVFKKSKTGPKLQ